MPSSIPAKNHPQPKGNVKGVNRSLDKTTSPSLLDIAGVRLKPNEKALVSLYVHEVAILVLDQFNNPLNRVYSLPSSNVEVTEFLGQLPLNVGMQPNGTYIDPVGKTEPAGRAFPVIINIKTKEGQDFEQKWLKAQPVPILVKFMATDSIPVEVGGHSLNPAIVKRTVEASPKDIIDVTWPDN